MSSALEGASGFAGRTESTSKHEAHARGVLLKASQREPPAAQGVVMPDLPVRPNLDQLRHQAKELLRAAKNGDENACARLTRFSENVELSAAQLAIAREYGFASWPKLKSEVERRDILNQRDLPRLQRMLEAEPALASEQMEHWCDHRHGVAPLNYIAMIRFDAPRLGLEGDLPGTGAIAQALVSAGAPVDGEIGDAETPLITAASYGDAEVAQVLIHSGADIDALSAQDSGGVGGGSALIHAAVFGMTDVLDRLVAAGARVRSIEEAAAAGDITDWLTPETPLQDRLRALIFAADHERLDVIDQLLAVGTPIDATDETFSRQALRVAAEHGRPASVRHLLAQGADPNLRDENGRTALDLASPQHNYLDNPRHREVESILRPLTTP